MPVGDAVTDHALAERRGQLRREIAHLIRVRQQDQIRLRLRDNLPERERVSVRRVRSEQIVLDAVRASGRTTLFVTHRRSVAERSDVIIAVDGGEIAGIGTHDGLLGEPWYERMWPPPALDVVGEPA